MLIKLLRKARGDSKEVFLAENVTKEALAHAKLYHPNWSSLNEHSTKLMGRNSQIVMGEILDSPSEFVVCWTPGGKIVGGTGQSIRIANDLGIRVFNLAFTRDLEELREFVRGLIKVSESIVDMVKPEPNLNLYDPTLDGINHINIYSKGNTLLGRFLTNFSRSPFSCEDGDFESIEGYWYWLGSSKDEKAEPLRKLVGFEAKKIGRELGCPDWVEGDEFERKIIKAIRNKIISNKSMCEEFKRSELPFVHYYNYGGKVVKVSNADWIMEGLEAIRTSLKLPSRLIYESGSLLDIPQGSTLGHSCNTLGNWGAGVAVYLRHRFPECYLHQLAFCKSGNVLGDYDLYEEGGYRVLSLFTSSGFGKGKSPESVILHNTEKALTSFLNKHPNTILYLPKINSGHFKVEWEKTVVVLQKVLGKFPNAKIVIRTN